MIEAVDQVDSVSIYNRQKNPQGCEAMGTKGGNPVCARRFRKQAHTTVIAWSATQWAVVAKTCVKANMLAKTSALTL
jgi:hypothetical protein